MCAAKAAMVVGTSFSRRSLRRAPSLRKSASVGICHSHNGSGEPSCIWQPVGRGEWTMAGTSSGFGEQGKERATFYRKLPRRASLQRLYFAEQDDYRSDYGTYISILCVKGVLVQKRITGQPIRRRATGGRLRASRATLRRWSISTLKCWTARRLNEP